MNARLGWALALAAVVAGYVGYGWRGLVLAASVVAFWLLLQLNRSIRVMRDAAGSPLGHVPSAVMLQSKLAAGMPMLQIVKLTKSLGRKLGDAPETWAWRDDGGSEVRVEFDKGRCARWTLVRPDTAAETENDGGIATT